MLDNIKCNGTEDSLFVTLPTHLCIKMQHPTPRIWQKARSTHYDYLGKIKDKEN